MNVLDAIDGWASSEGPLYRRLAAGLRRAIERGELPPGTVLPPERALAHSLAVGRNTIVAAYDLLRTEGVVESRQGSGTWVAGRSRGPAEAGGDRREALSGAAPASGGNVIDLATASLTAAPAVREVLAGFADEDRDLDALLEQPGYTPLGTPQLRTAVADMFTSEGLPTKPHEILVTTGDQQALSLLTELLVNPNDLVLASDPTSPGMLDLLRARKASIGTLGPLDGPEPAAALVSRVQPRLLYLMASLNPVGAMATEQDLRSLARAVSALDGIAVEDASNRHLGFREPPPYLAALAEPDGPDKVVTVGSMSKLFWGGLRVGWIRANESLIGRLGRHKARTDLGTPLLSQYVSARLLGRIQEVRADRVAELHRLLGHATRALGTGLPEFAWAPPDGGVSLWARMPWGSSAPFAELARRRGVAVVAGTSLSPGGGGDEHIRIAYGRPAHIFAEGVARLAATWQEYGNSLTRLRRNIDDPWVV